MPTKFQDPDVDFMNLPLEDVYILNQTHFWLGNYPGVYQNFTKDMYQALVKGLDKLKTYEHLKLIFSAAKEPEGMAKGFKKFVVDYNFPYSIQADFLEENLTPQTVYIVPNDRHLVRIIEQSKRQNLTI